MTAIQTRLGHVRIRLEQHGCSAFLFLDRFNIRYLCGFTGSEGALLVWADDIRLFVDGRYTTQARQEAPAALVVEYKDKVEELARALSRSAAATVGFDPASMDVKTFLGLQEKSGNGVFRPLPVGALDIRAVKDQEEIEHLRKAAQISADALRLVIGQIRPGAAEKDIADDLEYVLRKQGAQDISFPIIVASGPRSALPHAAPGSRVIQDGDLVVVDYGAVHEGYHADETCTFVVGQASEAVEKMHTLVKKAHDQALKTVQSGISCREVDQAARHCIEEGGMGLYFSHGTGHGVGLDVHEPPRLSQRSDDVLSAGMVVTIEPGVYLPGVGGVRIEDMVLVTDNKPEVLTKIPKTMQIL